MNPRLLLPAALTFLLASFAWRTSGGPEPRAVAVTFDDLPLASPLPLDDAERERITARLLEAIGAHRVPAVGFVNEGKLADAAGRPVERRVALLRKWLDAGLELGNHGYGHLDLHHTPPDSFRADVLRGERVTRRLLAERGRAPRYFRHPFLHTGRSVDTRARFERFLADHGYRVAPVTVDNYDYLFAAAYDRAGARGDTAAARRVAETYLDYMTSVFAYYEQQSTALFGREIPQVLLLHANRLNADRFGELAARLRARGYRFIPLDEAIADTAYRSADRYEGPAGITWLHRWALTAGKRSPFFNGEPVVPEWIARAAEAPR